MKFKIWWIPQVPMKSFWVEVPNLQTAKLMLDTLAKYDLFQFENNIKPDYCNIGGLMYWEPNLDGEGIGGWTDWSTNYSDETIDDLTMEQCIELDLKIAQHERKSIASIS